MREILWQGDTANVPAVLWRGFSMKRCSEIMGALAGLTLFLGTLLAANAYVQDIEAEEEVGLIQIVE
jgi:hypothetical protein